MSICAVILSAKPPTISAPLSKKKKKNYIRSSVQLSDVLTNIKALGAGEISTTPTPRKNWNCPTIFSFGILGLGGEILVIILFQSMLQAVIWFQLSLVRLAES